VNPGGYLGGRRNAPAFKKSLITPLEASQLIFVVDWINISEK
jgi:hypothetical protein